MDRPQSVTRALVNMVGAAVAFAILNAAVKSLRGEIPTVQLVWVRTLGHLLFVVAAFAPRHGLQALRDPASRLPARPLVPPPRLHRVLLHGDRLRRARDRGDDLVHDAVPHPRQRSLPRLRGGPRAPALTGSRGGQAADPAEAGGSAAPRGLRARGRAAIFGARRARGPWHDGGLGRVATGTSRSVHEAPGAARGLGPDLPRRSRRGHGRTGHAEPDVPAPRHLEPEGHQGPEPGRHA